MSGIVSLSVNPEIFGSGMPNKAVNKKFVDILFWITFYHQHLGQEYGGMASSDTNKISLRTEPGFFRDKFEQDLAGFTAPLGISHISAGFEEPFLMKRSRLSRFAICFAGNIINKDEIIEKMTGGHGLARDDDVVLISQLLSSANWKKGKGMDENFLNAITYMTEQVEGAYALSILTSSKIYVARGPDGHEPLTVAKRKGAVAIVSESCSLYNQGFEPERELDAGEIVVLENGIAISKGIIRTRKKIPAQLCSFKWVYTSSPNTVINHLSAAEGRRRLGANQARRDIRNNFTPHLVIPIPDSGRFHAIGYKQEYDRQINRGTVSRVPYYDEFLVKYPYAGRSYTPADSRRREIEALKKIIPIIEEYMDLATELVEEFQDKKEIVINIVVLDDSIVRGTQTVNDLIPKLKAVFSQAFLILQVNKPVKLNIHLRIGNPKLVAPCPYGKANKEQDDLAAFDEETGNIRSAEMIAERLGVKSCFFNTVEDVSKAIGIPLKDLCVDCDIVK